MYSIQTQTRCIKLIVNFKDLRHYSAFPVGKIAEKQSVRVYFFLATWHCILSAELTKTPTFAGRKIITVK